MDKLSPIKQVATGIIRILGLNPGPFTLEGTNTYLFGEGERRLLVDTGDGEQPRYYELLKQCLGSSRIDRILLTHWHPDHIGGVNRLLDMPELVTTHCVVYKNKNPTTDNRDDVKANLAQAISQNRLYDISDKQTFDVDGIRLQAIYTPGHTDDHMSFVVGSSNAQVEVGKQLLVTGDLVLGRGTTIVYNLQEYMQSLHRTLHIRPAMLLPGHGPIISGSDGDTPNAVRIIEGYIAHRNMRERQIIDVLGSPPPDAPPMPRNGGWKLEEITSAVYTDITDPKIIIAAQHNTRLHLDKLLDDGMAKKAGDLWMLIDNLI
ncbi:Beta-lactamase-like protein 2 [Coemansia sp. RSA 2618]|nr:Beta-lactamase-like protein 2 [Coemansia sp. RSA 2618]